MAMISKSYYDWVDRYSNHFRVSDLIEIGWYQLDSFDYLVMQT